MHRKYAAILDNDPDYHRFAEKYDAETAAMRLIDEFDPEIEEFVSRIEEMYVDAQAYQKKAQVGTT
jgi:thiamine pyrophosphate-dependent acetolactate synthase large subunit-like protein